MQTTIWSQVSRTSQVYTIQQKVAISKLLGWMKETQIVFRFFFCYIWKHLICAVSHMGGISEIGSRISEDASHFCPAGLLSVLMLFVLFMPCAPWLPGLDVARTLSVSLSLLVIFLLSCSVREGIFVSFAPCWAPVPQEVAGGCSKKVKPKTKRKHWVNEGADGSAVPFRTYPCILEFSSHWNRSFGSTQSLFAVFSFF